MTIESMPNGAANPESPDVRATGIKPLDVTAANMDTIPPAESKSAQRWWLGGIMLVLTLWGAYLARGAYLLQRSVLQGSLVLICMFGFLAFWGVMLVGQKSTRQSRYSQASIAGFVCGLLALLLTIPDLSQPGAPLLISAALLGLSVLLSVIGLSRPRPLLGKNLGLFVLPIVIVWLYLIAQLAG